MARNRFVRWWVLGAPHEQPIFTPVFKRNVIQLRVSAAFQLRFSYVSAHSKLFFYFFLGYKIPALLKVKLLVKLLFCLFQLRFSWQKRGAQPLNERAEEGAEDCCRVRPNTSP